MNRPRRTSVYNWPLEIARLGWWIATVQSLNSFQFFELPVIAIGDVGMRPNS